jgi:hypothetical protein
MKRGVDFLRPGGLEEKAVKNVRATPWSERDDGRVSSDSVLRRSDEKGFSNHTIGRHFCLETTWLGEDVVKKSFEWTC